jgi:hypothetical protein
MCSDCTTTDTIGKAMNSNIVTKDGKINQKKVLFFIKIACI